MRTPVTAADPPPLAEPCAACAGEGATVSADGGGATTVSACPACRGAGSVPTAEGRAALALLAAAGIAFGR